jgi:hypothetical protein
MSPRSICNSASLGGNRMSECPKDDEDDALVYVMIACGCFVSNENAVMKREM